MLNNANFMGTLVILLRVIFVLKKLLIQVDV